METTQNSNHSIIVLNPKLHHQSSILNQSSVKKRQIFQKQIKKNSDKLKHTNTLDASNKENFKFMKDNITISEQDNLMNLSRVALKKYQSLDLHNFNLYHQKQGKQPKGLIKKNEAKIDSKVNIGNTLKSYMEKNPNSNRKSLKQQSSYKNMNNSKSIFYKNQASGKGTNTIKSRKSCFVKNTSEFFNLMKIFSSFDDNKKLEKLNLRPIAVGKENNFICSKKSGRVLCLGLIYREISDAK